MRAALSLSGQSAAGLLWAETVQLQSQLDGEWGGGTLETGYKVDQTKILMDKRAVDTVLWM